MSLLRIDRNTRLAQSREPVAVGMEDTVVMMSLARGKYYGLDRIGTRIWELLAEPTTPGDLCDQLVREFEVDPETCARDVNEFLQQLAAEGLISVVDESTDPLRPASGA